MTNNGIFTQPKNSRGPNSRAYQSMIYYTSYIYPVIVNYKPV